jgi:hypothetical protein
VLPKFVGLNEYFQSERVITALSTKVCDTYKTLLLSSLNPNYINDHHLADINPRLNSEFLNLTNIYLGIEVLNYVDELDEAEKMISILDAVNCFMFGNSKRFDFRDALLSQISIFDPKSENRPNSIFNIAKNLIELLIKIICKKLMTSGDYTFSHIQSYLQKLKMRKIYKLTDMAGNFKFTELRNFVLDLMVMPHSNATCERVFSKANLIKTKIRKKLCTETIDGLILASEYAKDCHSFEINEKTIKLMSHNLYGSSETEDSDENEEIIFENPQST